MNRQIRGLDINLAQVLHLEEIASGDWRGVDVERNSGICIYTWEMIITRIADLIQGGYTGKTKYIYTLEISQPPARAQIDMAGNIWLDHEYLAPHQYLPRLIPETIDLPDRVP